MTRTSDTRITGYEPLLSPSALLDRLPLDDEASATVEQSRAEVRAVLDGSDDRLLVIAGPCSVHDPAAALDYASRLIKARELLSADLLIVDTTKYPERARNRTMYRRILARILADDFVRTRIYTESQALQFAKLLLRDTPRRIFNV